MNLINVTQSVSHLDPVQSHSFLHKIIPHNVKINLYKYNIIWQTLLFKATYIALHAIHFISVFYICRKCFGLICICFVLNQDYHFVTKEKMQEGIDQEDFIENAEFSGNMYGTSKSSITDVQAQNLICILDVDIQGVKNIKKTDLNPIYISIQPPSMEILEKRLRDRQTETEESLQKRLEAARIDMELSKEPGTFDLVIINDDLEEAYEKLKSVLIEEIQKVQDSHE